MCLLQEIMIHRNKNVLQKLSRFNKIQLTQGRAEIKAGAAILRHVISHFLLRECPLLSWSPWRTFSLLIKSQQKHLYCLEIRGFQDFFSCGISKFLLLSTSGEHQNLSKFIQLQFALFKKKKKSHSHVPEFEDQPHTQ